MGLLRLYPAGEREFRSNGLGALSDLADSRVTEELNSKFELTFRYPVEGMRYSALSLGRIVTAAPGPDRGAEPFRIHRITRPMNGLVDVLCRHVCYDLAKVTCSPFTAESAQGAVAGLAGGAAFAHPFSFSCGLSKAGAFALNKPGDIWAAMGTKKGGIVALYGGEWEFSGFSARLVEKRGRERGMTIRYGKNLTDYEQEDSMENLVTGIHPYWNGKKKYLLELPEKVIWLSENRELDRVVPVDLSDALEAYPTEDQLRQAAWKYIEDNGLGEPELSLDVDFVQLSRTLEYAGTEHFDRVGIGDTVQVYMPKYGANVAARAVKTVYLPHLERYERVTLGNARRRMGRTVAGIGRQAREAAEAARLAGLEE